MKLVVGLGNPGRRYAGTRHNVGFDVIDTLAKRARVSVKKKVAQALVGEAVLNGEEVLLVKPQTFMNLSGQAVGDLARRFRVKPEDVLVIYDDLDLPTGKIRIRPKGSAGGHNGMKSIIHCLGTQEFPRIRIGIGSAGDDTVDYVLSRFSRKDREVIDRSIELAADAVETFISDGIDAAMNRFNAATNGSD
jgi:PTH1 family peptidyl-tRNA hydrolase